VAVAGPTQRDRSTRSQRLTRSPGCTRATSRPGPQSIRSRPGPPASRSLPLPPASTSFPRPPSRRSAPEPPWRQSSPSRARTRSAPPRVKMRSERGEPVNRSRPRPPASVWLALNRRPEQIDRRSDRDRRVPGAIRTDLFGENERAALGSLATGTSPLRSGGGGVRTSRGLGGHACPATAPARRGRRAGIAEGLVARRQGRHSVTGRLVSRLRTRRARGRAA